MSEESVEEGIMVEQLEEKSMWEPVEWDFQMEPEV